MSKMDFVSKSLVVGLGEVGIAITKILECDGIDRDQIAPQKSYEFLHICIPFGDNFVEIVKNYQDQYSPDHTIIHSTVPIGTSKLCHATHSPIRGIHPMLEQGIRTFTKYFGGEDARKCAELFAEKHIPCFITSHQENTEALKLWDTTIYGINILIEKEIHEFCAKNGLNFNLIYTEANKTYNKGYAKLGCPQFVKYILDHKEGGIGGHCIKNNCEILDTPFAKFLKEHPLA